MAYRAPWFAEAYHCGALDIESRLFSCLRPYKMRDGSRLTNSRV
jgi:hypothetical protein